MGSLDQLNQWNYSSDMSDFSDYLRSSGNGTVEDLDNILGVLQDNTSWDDDDEMMMNAVNFSDSNDLPEFLPSDLPILPEQQQLSSPVLKPLEKSLATQVTHSTPTAPTPVLSAADKMRVFKQLQLQQQKELQQQQQQTQQQTQQQQQPSQQQQQPSQQQQQPSQQPIVLSPQSQQQQSLQQPQQQSNTNPLQQIIKLDTSTPQKQLLVVVPPSTWFTNADTAVVTQPQVVIQQADGTNNVTTTTQGNTVSSITTLPVSSVTTLTTSVDKLPISPSPSSKGTLPQLPKGEKRVAHNAIEKRYRRSINDRIETLRQMVVGSDAKIQKSGILQRAIDQINYLRKLSEKLKNENTDLRAEINRMKGAASLIIKAEPPTPPASETQSPRPSPGQMEIIEPPSPKSESGETGIIGMTDRSRFTLCIFMFAVLLFNPFGFLLGKAAQNFAAPEATFEHVMDGGRTLKGVAAEEEMSPLWSLAMSSSVWVVNAILILAVIIQILIKGEPVTKPNSEASAEYWRHRQAAETEIHRNEHVYALSQTQLALKALGRNIPVSRFDMWACTVWNFLRFFLNKVFIGRWLAKRAGGYEKDDSEDGKYTTAETSARDAAIMYLQYLQIALVSSKPLSALSVTSIGLVTLNLAHCAGNALSSESIAEVYATVALAIKHTFPRKMRFVSRYFFSKGRTYAKEYNTPAYLSWMHNAMAYQLVKQEDIPFVPRKSLFSQIAEPSNPLSCLTQGLHEEMLETALYQLVVPMEKNGKKDLLNGEPQDALHILAYLEDPDSCGRPPQDTLSFVDCRDVCRWWSEIIIVAAHWMLGDEEAAERRYYSLEKLPAVLEFSDDSLPKAALLAFKARKLLMSAGGNQDTEDVSEECKILCDKASTYLQMSISYTGPLRHEKLHAGIHLLVADWLLATRTTLWQQRQPKESSRTHLATSSELDMFQQDLSALRRVASSIKSVMPKVYLYQAVSRFMAGANPAQTQQLLDRSLRQKIPSNSSSMFATRKDNPDVVVSKRDRGQALIVACRYLPESILSYPNQRERMLNEAARCFEQAGDRWGLKECQQLLANVKKECGEAGEGISRRSAILTS